MNNNEYFDAYFSQRNVNSINECKLFNVMSSRNIKNGKLILEGLMRAMTQLTERNQLIKVIYYL